MISGFEYQFYFNLVIFVCIVWREQFHRCYSTMQRDSTFSKTNSIWLARMMNSIVLSIIVLIHLIHHALCNFLVLFLVRFVPPLETVPCIMSMSQFSWSFHQNKLSCWIASLTVPLLLHLATHNRKQQTFLRLLYSYKEELGICLERI